MKARLFLALVLLIFLKLAFVPAAFSQDASSGYVVRIIYFHPTDRQPQPEIDALLDALLKDVQQFYADEMERHGFGKKTFKLETDERGKTVVFHVKGKFDNTHYYEGTKSREATDEMRKQLDLSKKVVYFIWVDLFDPRVGTGQIRGSGDSTTFGGEVFLHVKNFDSALSGNYARAWTVTAHELGHAFGLKHDFRNDSYIMSYGSISRNQLALCAAEWLNVHKYFNTARTTFNQNTNVQLLAPILVAPPATIRLQFEISDPDGLHQAKLLSRGYNVLSCKLLSGKNSSVEFVTSELIAEPFPKPEIVFQVIDVLGNFKLYELPLKIDPLVSRGNDVVISDLNLAATIREALELTPNTIISQLDMVRLTRLGATEEREALRTAEHQITDLTGLQHATNLKYLSLWENQIRDITPLAELTQLKGIWLRNNHISQIPSLAGLIQLTHLDMADNQIREITPFTELTQLQSLSLDGNQINDASQFALMAQLRYLELRDNQIRDITSLTGLTNLSRLQLDHNNISDLSPLVANMGLGSGDSVYVWGNPLSYSSIYTHIPTLRERGVEVKFLNRRPNRVRIVSGYDQQGLPSAVLPSPFLVEIKDQRGIAFEGVPVTFTVTSGDGSLSTTYTATDANGRAESTLTLGPSPGTNTVTVSVTGSQEQQTFSAEGVRIPTSLEIISGDDQQRQPGAALEKPFVVEVRDHSDNPLPEVQVTFSVTSGGGSLSAGSVTTDASGRAESTLTLGPEPGTNTVAVAIADVQGEQIFTAEGVRTPTSLEIISGDDQQGQPGAALEMPFVVEVRDKSDNPLPDVQVMFSVTSGGGTLSATPPTTDSDGRVESTLTLGPAPGTNTVTVSVTGIQEERTFNAEGIRIPKAFWIISGFDQQGVIGEALSSSVCR